MRIEEVLHTRSLDQHKLKELDDFIAQSHPPIQEELIHILHKAQHLFGYLPATLQRHIALKCQLTSAHVNGVVSFYSYFNEEPMGKYTVSVCMGTACFVKGADKVLDIALKEAKCERNKISDDGLFTVKDVRCIGACGLAPVVTVNEKVIGHVDAQAMKKTIIQTRRKNDEN